MRGTISWREKRGKGNPKTTLSQSVCIEVNNDKKVEGSCEDVWNGNEEWSLLN